MDQKDINFIAKLYEQNLTFSKKKGLLFEITSYLFSPHFLGMLVGSALFAAVELGGNMYGIPLWQKLCLYVLGVFPIYLAAAGRMLALSERFFLFHFFIRWPSYICHLIPFVILVSIPPAVFFAVTHFFLIPLSKTYHHTLLGASVVLSCYLFSRLWPMLTAAFVFDVYAGVRVWFKSGLPAAWFMTGRIGSIIAHRLPVTIYGLIMLGFFYWINIIRLEPQVRIISLGAYACIIFPWLSVLLTDRGEALRLFAGFNREAFFLDIKKKNDSDTEVLGSIKDVDTSVLSRQSDDTYEDTADCTVIDQALAQDPRSLEGDASTTPLHTYVSKGNVTAVEHLIKLGAPLNKQNKEGQTPLHIACKNGFYRIAALLLHHQGEVITTPSEKVTPLQYAALMGYQAIARLLLTCGAQMDLFSAAALGDTEQVRLILDQKTQDINASHDIIGGSCLHCAVLHGQTRVLETLLDHGADTECRDTDGNTPLILACYLARTDMAEMLVAKGANINAINAQGQRPLWWAIEKDNKPLVQILSKRGAKR
ncbi:MAG: ankyrin repeat domain-containing protein [Deltaproteobacteria bacterium]|nr:ankyrin repeat domain-containing protein [Deltaproteobacteria bacterium]